VSARWAASLLLAFTVVLAAGCGGGEDEQPPLPQVRPAKTEAEWANRLVSRFLGPIERDLQVVAALPAPDIQLGLYSGDAGTIELVDKRMKDLGQCSYKLARVGRPPKRRLKPIQTDFSLACGEYERLAGIVLDAVPLLTSDDPAKKRRGRERFAGVREPTRLGARHFGRALRRIQKDKTLRDLVFETTG
jgi:hypothetical protein